jgi:hypothetical protein
MGKKLRSRELLTETDLENEEEENVLPIVDKIRSSTIRKNLKSIVSIKRDLRGANINSTYFFIHRLQKTHD